ncbi:EamA/RhaT family transporter [Rhodococcus sp. RS1C4]|uniref:DMT family transporter n=1 Tax=Nocardiaceae TaxID=85025 RepID=UPI000522F5C9|nr:MULTISPECIES: DMT family transporter [Rhodococcus]OZC58423.1 EamA/RhaT family transporter [Rhodococcus sp. RS1C4]OZC88255.1 EamA/RhaT family transporter [Rhodococcus sp. 06-418-1B]OZD11828.1 EamA/RhaT family transporter [Rhodococcus sp. 06-156-4C]OZD15673.1 EamA/RhaT family transporter [Rhodococcus sp. 06-156-4a]OZD23921.1 EamA/RhaT family transporter [Rhodococcus sp. 06-156-3C]
MTDVAVTKKTDWLALGAVTVTVVSWASAFVAIRGVGTSFGAGPLALGRLLIGTGALGLILLAKRTWVRPTRTQWIQILSVGVFWFAIYNVALNAAEQRVDAGTTSMIIQIGPILVALFAGLLLGEGFPRWLVIGAAIAFSGAVLVGVVTAVTTTDTVRTDADALGIALCLVSAVTYAIGVLCQKPVLRSVPGLQVTWMACAIGALCTLPFAPALLDDLADASAQATGGLLYLGLVPTALAFSTWAYALTRMDAGRLGITTYAVPPITVALSWALLNEVPHILAVLGGVVCLVGVGLSRRR